MVIDLLQYPEILGDSTHNQNPALLYGQGSTAMVKLFEALKNYLR
jgi:hypothetical protein